MKQYLILCFILLAGLFSNAQTSDSLKVVSWNVFLRPGVLKDKQIERVDSIAASILKMDADVVVLQEVFHKRSRKRLINALSQTYPYHTKIGKRTFWGVPSGNCIFSKDSIQTEQYIYFKRAMKADKMARKGAISVRIAHAGKSFKIFGTHLQAGGGRKGALIRRGQIDQLVELANQDREAPSIFAGDFNVHFQDTLYEYMVQQLNVANHLPSNKERGTANFNDHTLTSTSGTPKWIDFVLFRVKNGMRALRSRIEEPRCLFGKKLTRVSDHNPILTVFHW